MARRSGAASGQALALPAPNRPISAASKALKHAALVTAIAMSVAAVVWAYVSIEHFVVTDSRFFLPGPPEPGQKSEYFQIEGMTNVAPEQVIRVFASDFGRSIYLCPLKARRLKLLGIDWVKDVSVSRLWPNRIVVRLIERKPAAFAQMRAADRTMRLSLVDPDGVLLDPQAARPFRLPVLTGMNRTEGEASRRERMKRFLRMQAELGRYMDKISEIDVSELENIKVVQQFDGRALALMLGNQNFRQRYETFLHNQDEIRRRLPDAVMLDLQLKDRITAVAVPFHPPSATGATR